MPTVARHVLAYLTSRRSQTTIRPAPDPKNRIGGRPVREHRREEERLSALERLLHVIPDFLEGVRVLLGGSLRTFLRERRLLGLCRRSGRQVRWSGWGRGRGRRCN